MLRIVLIQPGATNFDDQGRIKGTLNIPLSENGAHQVARTVGELADLEIEHIYTAPCQSAQQTAGALAEGRDVKVKSLETSKEDNNGITLIPEKNIRFKLQSEDSLVVLAEDEL